MVITLKQRGDGKYVAHCLDYDLVSVHEEQGAALHKLSVALRAYVEYGERHALDLWHPAPPEFWEKYGVSIEKNSPPRLAPG